jgi:hypothetical protein
LELKWPVAIGSFRRESGGEKWRPCTAMSCAWGAELLE